MLRYRLIYAIVLSTALSFYLVYRPWFSWYLLILVLVLLPLDLISSLPGLFSKSVKLTAPVFLEQGSSGALTISVIHKKTFPVKCLFVLMHVIGDDFVARCSIACPAGTVNRGQVSIDTSKSGLTVFEAKRFYTVSLLGLFSSRTKIDDKVSVLILPPPCKPDDTLELPRGMVLKPKPGGGFSEEHDMRKYLPGDPVRSIHWKLSAKHDTLIVREPLVPPQQSRLIHIMPWKSASQRDSALSHLRWVSDYLLSRGLLYYIKFGDRQHVREITSQEDLIDFLRYILDNSILRKSTYYPRITRFSWIYKIVGTDTADDTDDEEQDEF